MSLSLLDEADPETEDSPSILTRISNLILGDPRKAPRRILTLLVFLLFGIISLGVWLLLNSQIDTSGSSAPIVGPALSILTSVWTIPVVTLWFTRQWVLFNRSRKAKKAADVTGWTVETIVRLREEIKTTDGCTRIIASTGESQAEIEDRIDAGLDGEYDDDTVDFWAERATDDSEKAAESEAASEDAAASIWDELEDDADDEPDRIEELRARERDLTKEYNRKAERIEEVLESALEGEIDPAKVLEADDRASFYELVDDESQDLIDEADALLEECDRIDQELEEIRTELETLLEQERETAAVVDDLAEGFEAAAALDDALYEEGYNRADWFGENQPTEDRSLHSRIRGIPGWLMSAPSRLYGAVSSDSGSSANADTARDHQVPWRVRFLEEAKHLWLDLQSGFRTGAAAIKFGVPALVAFVLQLFLVGLWTTLPVYGLILATSTLVGLASFWIVKRRRQRRLRRYRRNSTEEYWYDCAGQFKTVQTADVTAYMAFIGGRRYAAYDREEFTRKTSRVMYQHISDEPIAPSNLQHYARCLEQMQPNLKGHRENVLKPGIMTDLEQTVRDSEDELIPKAELAWSVIEQPTTSRIERRLGHDPELVASEYKSLVDDLHVLDEHKVEFLDANGETQSITLVFPSDKNRLPDISERHSQFSDRFTDKKGDPVYEMPEVDPRDGLQGFIPTPREAALLGGMDPGEVATAGGD
ncbi:hypothetical protein [Natrinema thermotolerans]